MNARTAIQALPALALVMGTAELSTAPDIEVPWFAAIFGVAFLLGAALVARGRVLAGAVVITLFSLFEIVNYPFWTKQGVGDWLVDTGFLLVSLAAVVCGVRAIAARRHAVAEA